MSVFLHRFFTGFREVKSEFFKENNYFAYFSTCWRGIFCQRRCASFHQLYRHFPQIGQKKRKEFCWGFSQFGRMGRCFVNTSSTAICVYMSHKKQQNGHETGKDISTRISFSNKDKMKKESVTRNNGTIESMLQFSSFLHLAGYFPNKSIFFLLTENEGL